MNIKIISDEIEYLEFHDPGWMLLKDATGNEIKANFYYEFINYEQIDSWERGEIIHIVYKPEVGLGLVREKENRFYKVAFRNGADPIGRFESECLDNAMTTVDTVNCYKTSIKIWKSEYKYFYSYLLSTSSDSLKNSIEELDEACQISFDRFIDAYEVYSHEKGGTIYRINLASLQADFMRQRVMMLIAFFE